MESFGQFIKTIRIEREITLRDFCRRTNLDPSNWSKIERGVMQPPKSRLVLSDIARVLDITEESENWHAMFDLAVASHIPSELVDNDQIVEYLPLLFRTLRGKKPSSEDLRELIDKIRKG